MTTTAILTWLAIALCISQSGMFAGLNLAVFSLSRLRLEIEARATLDPLRPVLVYCWDTA